MRLTTTIIFEAKSVSEGQDLINDMLEVGGLAHCKAVSTPVAKVNSDTVWVFTDGGCDLRKGGLGAWAYIIRRGDGDETQAQQAVMGTTNNRMELMAVIEALKALEIGPKVTVVSDSEYVIKGTTIWSRNWIKNGWMTRNGEPVVNRDLWEELVALYQVHQVTFQHVRGHTGHIENERCDTACTETMQAADKTIRAGGNIPIDGGCQRAFPEEDE